MSSNKSVVIWDFDGTLVDTRKKNFNVTRKIVREVSGQSVSDFPALDSLEDYWNANTRFSNWREMYAAQFKFSDDQIDQAGLIWSEYQLADQTEPEIIDGIAGTLRKLGTVPHGIVSQNGKSNINAILTRFGVNQYFREIVGYEEVGMDRQKPHPDGFLACLEMLRIDSTEQVFSIGDHETDLAVAANASRHLKRNGSGIDITTIAVNYNNEEVHWSIRADYIVTRPEEITEIILR